ncbi:PqqD family protein [Herbiconiux sp. CPCC 205716]|uniref:PqqD family protein n=1 Tax=Herbiconiux gentiana TaxID=2970912 RepID=A0ABT2GC08_9MICO|nr:PqqD family protein [Herbiconiux gentiana]MCS5713752.1 PqqD family protein [Herbiconiux gentiana]
MTSYRIGPDVAWHSSDDDGGAGGSGGAGAGRVAVLDLAEVGAVPFVLEGSAAAIWTAVFEHGDEGADGVVAAVAERFDLEPADVRADVDAFLAELVQRRLIEAEPDPAAASPDPT